MEAGTKVAFLKNGKSGRALIGEVIEIVGRTAIVKISSTERKIDQKDIGSKYQVDIRNIQKMD